jgi:hypothetical protein
MVRPDDAPSNTSFIVRDFIAKTGTAVIPQPYYFSDLAPTDFILFHKLVSTSKGRMFDAVVEIKESSLRDLKAIPKHAFQDCFENWKKRWERCILVRGRGCFEVIEAVNS